MGLQVQFANLKHKLNSQVNGQINNLIWFLTIKTYKRRIKLVIIYKLDMSLESSSQKKIKKLTFESKFMWENYELTK
jgi:hypothetical protein